MDGTAYDTLRWIPPGMDPGTLRISGGTAMKTMGDRQVFIHR
jgi:hypothetical protein